ncbi:MAG: extracellular solute-binding protein [Propionibacteriaceae bacterium]|nr:extracellular solute-binding protein [Propionibacteriaceae bacterium]
MSSKTTLRLLAAAAGASLLLASCGGGTAETPPADGTATIAFWSWNPDEVSAKPYLAAFEAAHPKIKVRHRFVQYSDYANTTQLALQSGSGPDVFGLQVGALTKQFAPLADDLGPVAAEKLGAEWKSKLLAADQLAVDGKQVALPWMVTGGGLVWSNQTLLKELGLSVPKTLAEMEPFCAKVKAAGKHCMVQGAKDSWQNIDVYQAIANQLAPGKFYQAMKGEASFTDPAFVQAFEIWKQFFDRGIFPEGALAMTAYPDANDAFKKGQAALIAFGTWQNSDTTTERLKQYQETYGADFNVKTFFQPHFFPAVADGATTGHLFGGPDVGFAVSARSSQKEAARTFVTWLTASEDGQKLMAKSVQQPALASVPLDLSDVASPEQVTALKEQEPALQKLIGQREIDHADVRTALGDALSSVASSQQSAADAAAAVQRAIESSR